MALPIAMRNCLDRLYDFVKASDENVFASEKIQVAGQNYKVRIYKRPHHKVETTDAEILFEIVKRS